MKMFRDKMQENKVPVYLAKKYVDDVDLMLETLRVGTRWNGSSLEWRKEWEDQDILENEDDDVKTMREVRKLSDSLISFIKLKEDVPVNHVCGKIPVLDFQVWAEKDTDEDGDMKTNVMFEFYEKPMSSKFVIMEESALPNRMKITTLSQEVIRRMRNTCRDIPDKRRCDILSIYMRKLERSGYSESVRRKDGEGGGGWWKESQQATTGWRRGEKTHHLMRIRKSVITHKPTM